MNRVLSFIIIALLGVVLNDMIVVPDVTVLTGGSNSSVTKALDVSTWEEAVQIVDSNTTATEAPYKNPFVTREVKQHRIKTKPAFASNPSLLRKYTLTGIVGNRAITLSDIHGKISVMKKGDVLEQAELIDVSGGIAVFKGPTGTFELKLK